MISKHSKIPPDSLEEANYRLHPRPYSDNARSARLLNPASLFPTTLEEGRSVTSQDHPPEKHGSRHCRPDRAGQFSRPLDTSQSYFGKENLS